MSLLARLTGLADLTRPRPWRLLRQAIAVLSRIASALEQQNQLIAAAHPEAAARLKQPEPQIESGVSYVDPMAVMRAEQVRLDVHRATGRWMNDDQLMDYLQATELQAITRDQELS